MKKDSAADACGRIFLYVWTQKTVLRERILELPFGIRMESGWIPRREENRREENRREENRIIENRKEEKKGETKNGTANAVPLLVAGKIRQPAQPC